MRLSGTAHDSCLSKDRAAIQYGRSDMSKRPTKSDLAAVAAFSELFDAPGFSPGEWVPSEKQKNGSYTFPWWNGSQVVNEWLQALYDHNIIDPDSGYMEESHAEFMLRLKEDSSPIADSDLATVRRVLTYVVRADRFVEGTLAEAFHSGVAQTATRRLGELVGRDVK